LVERYAQSIIGATGKWRESKAGVAVIGGIYPELLFTASFHESEGASGKDTPL
jgi:hypothetical protein